MATILFTLSTVADALRPLLFLMTVSALSFAVSAQQEPDDFRIVLSKGGPPQVEGDGVQISLVREVAGESLEWNVQTTKPHLVGRVETHGYFEVQRPHQVMPEVQDNFPPQCRPASGWASEIPLRRFLSPVGESSIREAPECAPVANVTGSAIDPSFLLAFPVNATQGNLSLFLSRDLTAPGFTLGTPLNVTHIGFYLETTTSEWAYADLMIRPKASGEEIRHPTASLARLQRFPIQGLDAATEYAFHVVFTDWSGNVAASQDVYLTTVPAPILPRPEITSVSPAPDARLPEVSEVVAAFVENASSISTASVFLDKAPVPPEQVRVEAGRVVFTPASPLPPGRHVVGVELVNALGGKASKQWAFHVEEQAATPAPDVGILLAALGFAMATFRRRPATVKVK